MINRCCAVLGSLLLSGVLAVCPALAQQAPAASDAPSHNLDAFAPVDLPAPSALRAADGRAGTLYWQQSADYAIDVTLDPEANRLSGTVSITYANNAPQPLERLWVQLEQNFFRPDSRGAKVVPPDGRFSGFFEGAGYDITRVQVERGGTTSDPAYTIDGTRMHVPLATPLAGQGGTLTLHVDFAFTIPEYGADRHGRLDVEQGTIYQLAQWYPRMYVYDDIDGWNALPYLGQGEYYLEYGTFTVDITVPRDHIVAATGVLQNPGEVLTETQQDRLADARDSREPVTIIDSAAVGTAATRPAGDGPLTWRYAAENVRDFSWASSPSFIWDAARAETGAEPVLAQSFYPKEGIGSDQNPGWEKSTAYVQHSVEFYSDTYAPYPYPMATNVAGVVAGMEYPQIMFCDYQDRGRGLFGVTDHEFGHTWFPMVVGSDERRWAWMDEGLDSFMNAYSRAAFYGGTATQRLPSLARRTSSAMRSATGSQPIMTYADRLRPEALGFLAYRKPAYGLMLLREYVIGPERFDAAFKAYFDRWAYKHPKPADFFRTIEDVTGEDLDWFWRSWFMETDVMDHAVASVEVRDDDQTDITVAHREDLMLPITVQIAYADGTTEERRVPAEAFFTSDTHRLTVSGTVETVTLDPKKILPDVNRSNDAWNRSEANSGSDASSE
jgi:hypothetical protein